MSEKYPNEYFQILNERSWNKLEKRTSETQVAVKYQYVIPLAKNARALMP